MTPRPSIYVTNLATVSATRQRGGVSGPAVGTGPVLGILRSPPLWSKAMLAGHVRALMPTRAMLWAAKSGETPWPVYEAQLRALWAEARLAPGELTIAHVSRPPAGQRAWPWDGDCWWPGGPVPAGATLVCTCATGQPCHRQVAAELLAAAGWFVVLDGQSVERVDAPEVAEVAR